MVVPGAVAEDAADGGDDGGTDDTGRGDGVEDGGAEGGGTEDRGAEEGGTGDRGGEGDLAGGGEFDGDVPGPDDPGPDRGAPDPGIRIAPRSAILSGDGAGAPDPRADGSSPGTAAGTRTAPGGTPARAGVAVLAPVEPTRGGRRPAAAGGTAACRPAAAGGTAA